MSRKSTRRLLSTVSVLSFAAISLAASERYAVSQQRTQIEHVLSGLPAQVGSLAVDPWRGRVSLTHVVIDRPKARVTVGDVEVANPRLAALALIGPAAAGVAVVTAHDIRIESGDTVLSIPQVEARGMGLNALDLARLFDPDSPRPLAERAAKLSGSSIVAPDITFSVASDQTGKERKSFTLHGLALTDIVAGKVGSLVIDGAESALGTNQASTHDFSVGRVSINGMDIPLAVSIFEGSRADAASPLRPLYEAFSIASIKLKAGDTESFEIGSIQSTALSGRPPLVPFKLSAPVLSKSGAELSDSERRQQTDIMVDLLKSYSLGRFEIRDVSFAKTGADDPTSLTLGRLLIDGLEAFRSRSIAAEHFALATKDVRVTFSRSALDGIDGSGFIDVVGSTNGPFDLAPAPEQLRRLAPKLADASLLDFRVEAPSADLTGNASAGHLNVFEVPVAELRIGPFVGNLASTGSSHMQAVYDIASPAPGSSLEALAKAGFARLDVTSDYSADWSESTQEFKLHQLSLSAKDLAALSLGATMSNMSADLMSPDKATSMQAARQLQLRTLSIGLADSGLADKGLPLAAASMNLSVPDLKVALNSQAADFIAKVFGAGPNADQLTAAVAHFIEKPKTLDISVRAPEGLSVQAIMGAGEPQALLGKLQITAVANR